MNTLSIARHASTIAFVLGLGVACGGKVAGGSGTSSASSASGAPSGSGEVQCRALQTCAGGGELEQCTSALLGVCTSIVYEVGTSSFRCESCTDCNAARAEASALCGPTDAGILCPPSASVGSFTPAWRPPSPFRPACNQANIDAFYKYCLGAGNPQACSAFLATAEGKTCAQCILSPPTAATYGPLIDYTTQGYVALNAAGCVAMAQGNDTCARAMSAKYECEQTACVGCKVTDAASLDALLACHAASDSQACVSYVSSATCGDTLIKSGGCPSPDDLAAGYATLVPRFCLAP